MFSHLAQKALRAPMSSFDWDLLQQQILARKNQDIQRVFLIGLSVGQGLQPTGIAVVEQLPPSHSGGSRRYACRHLCRLRPPGTTYPILLAKLNDMLKTAPLTSSNLNLIVEAGPGIRAVLSLLRKKRLPASIQPVEVKASAEDGFVDGLWRVTKASLIETTRHMLQEDRLTFDEKMPPKVMATTPSAQTIYHALATYPYNKTPVANDAFARREGADDDLILAVSLACWYGECCRREFWIL